MKFDAIVLGGGHNGLVAATLLAKRGKKVCLIEKNSALGGLSQVREFHPGFFAPSVHHHASMMDPGLLEALSLSQQGLNFSEVRGSEFFIPGEREGIQVSSNPKDTAKELSRFSSKDAAAIESYTAFVERIQGFIRDLLDRAPFRIDPLNLTEVMGGLKTAFRLRVLGKQDMLELMRVAPMCVADHLNHYFETKLLKVGLAQPALWGSFCGPWSPATAANLLLWESNQRVAVKGGVTKLMRALEKSARASGVEIKTAKVQSINVNAERASGVTLESGEVIDCNLVISSLDPKQTFLDLISPRELPLKLEGKVQAIRMRGTTAKVHLALKGELTWDSRPKHKPEYTRIGGLELDDLERSFDAVKYGEMSQIPALDVCNVSAQDTDTAPQGSTSVSVMVHFAPHALKSGWNAGTKKELGERVLKTFEAHSKNIRTQILGMEVLTPMDLETEFGATSGHIYHGEHALDQLWLMRPTPECARFQTPIAGLYLCGSGSHPGGGLTGSPGFLCAKELASQ